MKAETQAAALQGRKEEISVKHSDNSLEHIVLLIDADNTQVSKLEGVIQEISKQGRIVVKRAYANWKKENLKNWEGELKRLAIKPEQQFDYVTGKNVTDIALTIGAMDLLHKGVYDGFAIVSSDSDYTPLAIYLHESGVYVMGVGENKTPEAFKNSCDEFILLENIDKTQPAYVQESAQRHKRDESVTLSQKAGPDKKGKEPINEIHRLLRLAWSSYQDDDGYAFISNAGFYIKRVKPDFDVRSFGFERLTKLIESFPDRYETKASATDSIKVYKCK